MFEISVRKINDIIASGTHITSIIVMKWIICRIFFDLKSPIADIKSIVIERKNGKFFSVTIAISIVSCMYMRM